MAMNTRSWRTGTRGDDGLTPAERDDRAKAYSDLMAGGTDAKTIREGRAQLEAVRRESVRHGRHFAAA